MLLAELGGDLQPAEQKLLDSRRSAQMAFPLVLVMGPSRSGTTLFVQWLANTGVVAYPTNLLSRFYQAPIIGAKIQLLLTDSRYDFRHELGEFTQQVDYGSENGKTRGALAPNEFWYFWRRFLSDPARDVWTDRELSTSMDVQTLSAEFAGIMDVFRKPFLLKAMLFNYNIPFLNKIFDKVIFIRLVRDPISNIASMLDARKKQNGNIEQWYSFNIPEYEQLKDLAPREQVAGQVYYVNKAIDEGLDGVAGQNKMTVRYEEFCKNPEPVYRELVAKLGQHGYKVTGDYSPAGPFRATRADMDEPELLEAYRKFSG